ncbi:MAG: hypothetical protein KF782_18935, partial [Labilithrix sp.]|nr:hypothetical protein [Labilithrix sp.]
MATTSNTQLVDGDTIHDPAVPDDRSSTRDLRAITDDDLSTLMSPQASDDPLARTGSVPKGISAPPSPSASGKFASVAGRALPKPRIVKRVVKKSPADEPAPANEDTSTDVTIARTYEEATASKATKTPLRPPPLEGLQHDAPSPSSEVQPLADLLEGELGARADAPPPSGEVQSLADLLEGGLDAATPPKEVDPLAELTDLLIAATSSIADAAPAEREERTVMLAQDKRQEHTVMLAHDQLQGRPADAPSVFEPGARAPAAAPWSGATAPLPFAPVAAPAPPVSIVGLPTTAPSTRDVRGAAAEARDSAPVATSPPPAKPKRSVAPWIVAALAVGVAIGVVMMRQAPLEGATFAKAPEAPPAAQQPAQAAAPVVAVPAGDEANNKAGATASPAA